MNDERASAVAEEIEYPTLIERHKSLEAEAAAMRAVLRDARSLLVGVMRAGDRRAMVKKIDSALDGTAGKEWVERFHSATEAPEECQRLTNVLKNECDALRAEVAGLTEGCRELIDGGKSLARVIHSWKQRAEAAESEVERLRKENKHQGATH